MATKTKPKRGRSCPVCTFALDHDPENCQRLRWAIWIDYAEAAALVRLLEGRATMPNDSRMLEYFRQKVIKTRDRAEGVLSVEVRERLRIDAVTGLLDLGADVIDRELGRLARRRGVDLAEVNRLRTQVLERLRVLDGLKAEMQAHPLGAGGVRHGGTGHPVPVTSKDTR